MFKQQQQQMSHTRMMREELGQTLDHAMRAANHAASGISGTVGPRMMPMVERMRSGVTRGMSNGDRGRTGGGRMMGGRMMGGRMEKGRAGMMADLAQNPMARRKKQRTRQRRGRMMTMLAGGVAVGALAAFVMRRRRQREWEEYEANAAMERAELAEAGTTPSGGAGMTAGGTGQPGGRETNAPDARI